MNTCFAIMPFKSGFEDVDHIIQAAAKECGLKYVRGDRRSDPGVVLAQVVEELHRASVVVADISRHNPNVFYELGIAHKIHGNERVVILTQEVDGDKAYDIHQFRQFVYVHSTAGLKKLRAELPVRIRKALESRTDNAFWSVIQGKVPRTRMIVRDLEKLLRPTGNTHLESLTLRSVAGLGSLAISEAEPCEPNFDEEYRRLLVAERDAFRELLARGARLKAVLNPPHRFSGSPERRLQQQLRFKRLVDLLDGRSDARKGSKAAKTDLAAIQRCQFALSTVPMPNLLIVGDRVAYEGVKRGGGGGFEMTHCETDGACVRDLAKQFDAHFRDSLADMKAAYPPDGRIREQLRSMYDKALATATPSP